MPTTFNHPTSLEDLQQSLGPELFRQVLERLRDRLSYPPVIVFMGKTGAGKSSTCNALFGQDAFKVSDVEVGTRAVQIEHVPGKLTLVDVPGVGEGGEKSAEYREMYRTILGRGVTDGRTGENRKVDVIVWLIKSDDRALEVDKDFYDNVFRTLCSREQLDRVIFAISQADCMYPIRGEGSWETSLRRPGAKQLHNLELKRRQVSHMFGVESNHVIDFSANEYYGLDRLLDRVLYSLPPERVPLVVHVAELAEEKANRKAPGDLAAEVSRRIVSEEATAKASKSTWDTVVSVVNEVAANVFEWMALEERSFDVIKDGFRRVKRWLGW